MFQHERRRHARYAVRLAIKLQRGDTVMSAQLVNASAGGCLLQVSEPLTPGELLEVSIPELRMQRTRLLVLRSDAAPAGYLTAACFDEHVADEALLRVLSEEQQGSLSTRLLN
jgi:hypothetical protein